MRKLMYQYAHNASENWRFGCELSASPKVYFHNPFGLGDVFVSRTFVKKIVDFFPEKDFYYVHGYDPVMFKDIPRLKEITRGKFELEFKADTPFSAINSVQGTSSSTPFRWTKIKGTQSLHIATWYNSINEYQATYQKQSCFPILVLNFNNIFNCLKMEEIQSPKNFLPTVDYSKYQSDDVKEFMDGLKKRFKKIVLVCNEEIQKTPIVENFNINQTVDEHVRNNKDTAFIFTNSNFPPDSNVFFTDSILKKKPKPDVIYMGLIAEYCDIIIGRCSGPMTCTLTKNNLVDNPRQYLVTTDFSEVSEWAVERDYSKLEHVTPFNMEEWKSLLSRYF